MQRMLQKKKIMYCPTRHRSLQLVSKPLSVAIGQSPWICVLGQKGSQRAPARFRLPSGTWQLDWQK